MLLALSIEEQAYKTQYGILKQYQVQELTMDILVCTKASTLLLCFRLDVVL